MTEIVCTLPEDQKKARSEALRRGLLSRVCERRDLQNGIALRFPLESEKEVEEFVRFEEGCCSFATYETRKENESLWLHITGPAGTRGFFKSAARLSGSDSSGRALKIGLFGGGGALGALICCATPALAVLLASIGLSQALPVVAPWIDGVASLALIGAIGLIGWGFYQRHRLRRASAS